MQTSTASAGRALRALRRAVAGADYPGTVRDSARPSLLAVLGRPLAALLLTVVCVLSVQYLVDTRHLPAASAWAIALLTVSPLPWLFSRPLLAWRLMVVGLMFGTFNRLPNEVWPWSPPQIVVALVVLAVVATRVDGAVLVWVGAITVVPVWIFGRPSDVPAVILAIAFLLLVGATVRRMRRMRGALAEQSAKLAVQTEVSEREQARRAVLEERGRIARELHDVVAHHMSMLAVRAETAPYRLAEVSDPARREFADLAQAARDALTDMRRLLGVLRNEGADPELAPQPDLTGVTDLVENVRRAGMEVSYLPPPPDAERRPPAAVALAAFRIVQEALANATRHAPGATVTVQVWPGTHELSVRIHNGPPPATPDPGSVAGGGHGIAGMRDRAALLGGDFTAEPTPDGGYSVTATLPYDTTAETT